MLKKIALTVSALAMMAGVSYGAAGSATPQSINNVDGINFKTSSNVVVAYKNDAAAAPQLYGIVSKHSSGDTYYATSNMSTAIYKLQSSTYMGVPLSLSGTPVTGVTAGDTLFTGGGAYNPM